MSAEVERLRRIEALCIAIENRAKSLIERPEETLRRFRQELAALAAEAPTEVAKRDAKNLRVLADALQKRGQWPLEQAVLRDIAARIEVSS
ncbi:hypothetical protein ACSMXN_09380 [Jatrophihabitans sp. DSM 45814]